MQFSFALKNFSDTVSGYFPYSYLSEFIAYQNDFIYCLSKLHLKCLCFTLYVSVSRH